MFRRSDGMQLPQEVVGDEGELSQMLFGQDSIQRLMRGHGQDVTRAFGMSLSLWGKSNQTTARVVRTSGPLDQPTGFHALELVREAAFFPRQTATELEGMQLLVRGFQKGDQHGGVGFGKTGLAVERTVDLSCQVTIDHLEPAPNGNGGIASVHTASIAIFVDVSTFFDDTS